MRLFDRRLANARRLEEGITLVEVLAALMVLAIVMVALAASTIRGYAHLRAVKRYQHATALGNQAIESARDLDYEQLSMVDADLDPATDSQILTSCGSLGAGKFFDPDGVGPLNCERLVYSAEGGAIDDHVVDRTVDNETYTVKRYVTWVDSAAQGGPEQDYKRVVTMVEWPGEGSTRNFRASTLVYAAERGLPTVRFELTPDDQSLVAVRGAQVAFLHAVTNLGFTETFDLVMPNPSGRTWAKTFYRDVNNNGIYDSGTDTALTDTDGSGAVDTGPLVTDQRIQVLTVFTLASNEVTGDVTMVLTATPKSDASKAKQATNNLTITGTPPFLQLYLHNYPTPPSGNTLATKNLPMGTEVPSATSLWNYAQDVYGTTGRMTREVTALPTESNPANMINWVFQVPQQTIFEGDLFLHLNFEVIPDDQGRCNQGFWDVYIRRKSSATTDSGTVIASETNNNDAGCGKRWLDETISIPRTTVNANEWIEIKVMVDKVKGPGAIWAYDTTTYDSYATLPQIVLAPQS